MVSVSVDISQPFYSDDVYLEHPEAKRFEMMGQAEIEILGSSIATDGQKSPIELYQGKILDGRNRYHACKSFNITPIFVHLPDDTNPRSHVIARNVHRRHLSPAQMADLALEELDEEKKKAKNRKLDQLIQNKKNTVGVSEVRSVKKGRAIEIVAKRCFVSKTSVMVAIRVRNLNDPEINELWSQARRREATIKNVKEAIMQKFPPKPKAKSNNSSQTSREVVEKPKEEKLVSTQLENVEKGLEEVKENKRIIKTKLKSIAAESPVGIKKHFKTATKPSKTKSKTHEEKRDVVIKMRNKIFEDFVNSGKCITDSQEKKTPIKKTSLNHPLKYIENETSMPENSSMEHICLYCEKATVLAIKCKECGCYIRKVHCQLDFIESRYILRDPFLPQCENSIKPQNPSIKV